MRTDELIARLQSSDPEERIRAAEEIGEKFRVGEIEKRIVGVTDEELSPFMGEAELILRPSDAAPKLLLRVDREEPSIQELAAGLGARARPEVYEEVRGICDALIELLGDESRAASAAVNALIEIGPYAAEHVEEAALTHGNIEIRRNATRTLRELADQRNPSRWPFVTQETVMGMHYVLLELVREDGDTKLRSIAAEALANLCCSAAITSSDLAVIQVMVSSSCSALRDALNDLAVCSSAAKALAEICSPHGLMAVYASSSAEKAHELMAASAHGFIRKQRIDACEALVKTMERDDLGWTDRKAVKDALKEIGALATKPLIELIGNGDKRVSDEAAELAYAIYIDVAWASRPNSAEAAQEMNGAYLGLAGACRATNQKIKDWANATLAALHGHMVDRLNEAATSGLLPIAVVAGTMVMMRAVPPAPRVRAV